MSPSTTKSPQKTKVTMRSPMDGVAYAARITL
jgi:hypothetical protein